MGLGRQTICQPITSLLILFLLSFKTHCALSTASRKAGELTRLTMIPESQKVHKIHSYIEWVYFVCWELRLEEVPCNPGTMGEVASEEGTPLSLNPKL